MNIPDNLKIIKTTIVAHQYSGPFKDAIESLNKEGIIIVDGATVPSKGVTYVATVYICKQENTAL